MCICTWCAPCSEGAGFSSGLWRPRWRGGFWGGGSRFGTETRGRLHKDWVEFESGTGQNRPEHLPLPFSDPGADVAVTMEPSTSDARRGAMNRKVCDGACRRTGNRSRHFQLELGQREANGERERGRQTGVHGEALRGRSRTQRRDPPRSSGFS